MGNTATSASCNVTDKKNASREVVKKALQR